MMCSYKIVFDKKQDAWNWYDASRNPSFQGVSWRDKLQDDFLIEFDKIVDLPPKEAKNEINVFLEKVYKNEKTFYDKQHKKIEEDFSPKFEKACEWVERVTGKPLFFSEYTVYLTTFPRSPYNPEKGSFFFNIYNDWGLVNTFMHEVLHFQFIHYWQKDPRSPVSKLSDDEFNFLKESLTVVIDKDSIPPADYAETGYIPAHHGFREELHKEWVKHHNFDRLIKYGLQLLPSFIDQERPIITDEFERPKGVKNNLEFFDINDRKVPNLSWQQVYAYCNLRGKFVLPVYRDSSGELSVGTNLIGGTVEPGETVEEALRREVLEETNCKIIRWVPLGYQKVWNGSKETHYQLRVYAEIEENGDFISDPGSEMHVSNIFVNLDEVNDYLKWGEVGEFLSKKVRKLVEENKNLR